MSVDELAWTLARAHLSRRRTQNLLTILGIAVGVFSVIGVMTVITGLRENIESGLNVLGANSFQVTKYPAINFSDPRGRTRNRRDIHASGHAYSDEQRAILAELAPPGR